MASVVLALGWKEFNATPKVLYVGNDVDAAIKAVHAAGDKGQIVEGQVIRNPTSCVAYRHRFETVNAS